MTMHAMNEFYRFGSACWAGPADVRRAGLLHSAGLQIGYWQGRPLFLDGDAPMITIGGAGSGKLRDLLAYVVCKSPGQRALILDPRGELGAISHHIHAPYGDHAYYWNPFGLHALPQHACNPLDILKSDSPTFHADCKFIAESLIPLSGSANGQYFELRARDWLENIIKDTVEREGTITLPGLFRILTIISAAPDLWADRLEAMIASSHEGVRRTAGEMLTKQQDAPKEFGGVLGELYGHLGFLDDPALEQALEGPEVFSLNALTHARQPTKIFLNIPAELLSLWSPLVRLFFTVSMLYKSRLPHGKRLLLLVDEAGQLGRFEALLRAFTYGRGAGVRAWAIFQDAGQIVRNFGEPALQGFLGSAQMRQFFGVRDYQTAKMVSDMLGSETLHYDDELQQAGAERQKRQAALAILNGNDPVKSALDIAHYNAAAHHRTQQARPLLTPDEVLALPEDKQILFISGKNLPPVLADKYQYFMRREMAGLYLPNPYHPPADRVRLQTRFGSGWRKVVTEPVPGFLRSFPQHHGENWSYIKGHKPR